jgi:hypothetical protein
MADNTEQIYTRLCELYRHDPQQFENERLRLIRDTIEGFDARHRQKAYGLQFKIDCKLRPYRDPVMRMNKMVEIFWEGVFEFKQTLEDPDHYLSRRQQSRPGKVLPLPVMTNE